MTRQHTYHMRDLEHPRVMAEAYHLRDCERSRVMADTYHLRDLERPRVMAETYHLRGIEHSRDNIREAAGTAADAAWAEVACANVA